MLSPALLTAEQFYCNKSLKIIVYIKPGGLIDVSARKIAKILEDEYLDVPVVIENYPGAVGLKSLHYHLRQKPDGCQLMAITNSFISQIAGLGEKELLNKLHYLAMFARDYEALIINKNSEVKSVQDLKLKELIWSGPAAGGTDHLFAKKVWQALGTTAKWLPYSSGKQGMLAVAGGYADVYVGNPGDVLGFQQLKILNVAAEKRLKEFPDVRTFKEEGLNSLTGEVLWRGFAINKKVPKEKIKVLEKLLARVAKHPDWLNYLKTMSVEPALITGSSLQDMIDRQIQEEGKLNTTEQYSLADYWHYFVLFALILSLLKLLLKRGAR